MTTPDTPVHGVGASHGPATLGGAAPRAPAGGAAAGGAAFRALLDELEGRAETLAEKSRSELDPSGLAQAVDEARDSLHQALEISSELLEAWRQSRHQAGRRAP